MHPKFYLIFHVWSAEFYWLKLYQVVYRYSRIFEFVTLYYFDCIIIIFFTVLHAVHIVSNILFRKMKLYQDMFLKYNDISCNTNGLLQITWKGCVDDVMWMFLPRDVSTGVCLLILYLTYSSSLLLLIIKYVLCSLIGMMLSGKTMHRNFCR